MTSTQGTSVRVKSDTHRALQLLSVMQDRTMSEIIALAVTDYLEARPVLHKQFTQVFAVLDDDNDDTQVD